MKKIAALGLAATLAVTGSLASTGADAKQNWPYPHKQHHYYYPHSGFYLSAPFFFGFSFGPRYGYPYQYAGNLHVQWCASRYKTYNPYTNLFFIKKGVPAVCVSPYSRNW